MSKMPCGKAPSRRDAPSTLAEQLRSRGHDVVAVTERREVRGVPDAELLGLAQQEGRAVVTYNRDDFLALDLQLRHEERGHHGIVILNPRRLPPAPASSKALVESIEAFLAGGPPYPGFVHWLR